MTAIGGRLPRLLALVPWLLRHPDSHVADVAAHFGISEKQLTGDIQLLWMCGLPGYLPDDLLDFAFEDDRVSVTDPLTLTRPLRLSAEEATALQVAARALAEVGDLAERDALERAIVKLAVAAPAAPTALDLDVALDKPEGQLATLRSAIEAKVAVHLTYFVESRDELTERDVDPVRVISWGGRWYLDAWCRVAEGFRLFRLDRIRAATVLAEPSSVPVRDTGGEPSDGLYRPSPHDVRIVLELPPASSWVTDVYQMDAVEDLPDGWVRVSLRTADTRPLARLLLSLEAPWRVIEPAGLTELVREIARDAVEQYAS